MKGIILAGGAGTRLYPMTHGVSKQLLPVYDKPMIYYPLSTLMLGGIREILIITTPRDKRAFQDTLGDGSQWGLALTFIEQTTPRGLADAFILGADFIGTDKVALVLGRQPLLRHGPHHHLRERRGAREWRAHLRLLREGPRPSTAWSSSTPKDGTVISLEEKPKQPKSNYAIPGIYFYDNRVVEIARNVKPSARGEIEITDVNRAYLERGELKLSVLGRGTAWLDTGSPDALLQASHFIQTVETRQGLKIGCLEEIAYRKGFIDIERLAEQGRKLEKTEYGRYVLALASELR